MNDETIYLDHAAATPVDQKVLAAMQPYFSELFYNPSSPYAPAVAVRREYQAAKHRLAMAIGAKPDEIVITAGATESINLIFSSIDGHTVTSSIEHEAVLEAAGRGDTTRVDVTEKGIVTPDSVAGAIRPETELVSIALANNEIGTVQPIRQIAAVVRVERDRRQSAGETRPIWLHSDASQGVGQLDVHVSRLGVDAITINSAKIYGPKQVAMLWVTPRLSLRPQIVGGGQERGLRSGTENVAGVIGFATALELAAKHAKYESERLSKLRDQLQSGLMAAFPDIVVSGHPKHRLAGHLHISLPGLDAERLVFLLENCGVLVATGSACAANSGTRSHVLTAIGLAPETADGSLRLTLGHLSNDQNIASALDIICQEISREKKRVGV